VLRVLKGLQDTLVLQVVQDHKETKGVQVLKVRADQQGLQEGLVIQDLQDLKVPQDFQVKMVHKGHKVQGQDL
jgi:hypothetical protein